MYSWKIKYTNGETKVIHGDDFISALITASVRPFIVKQIQSITRIK